MNKIKASFLGIVVLGMGFIIWGMFSMPRYIDYFNTKTSEIDLNKSVGKSVKKLNDEVIEDVESNDYAVLVKLPNDDLVSSEDKALYPVYPVEGENIGNLTIPALNVELPIFQGTSEKELKKGVGHFIQSVLPGEKDNSVLSGHRETAFRKLGDLVIGDLLIVETSAGKFTYEVSGTRIVDKDDKTVIVPTENAVLTISTCYPFYYVGSAPERYIVSADLMINE